MAIEDDSPRAIKLKEGFEPAEYGFGRESVIAENRKPFEVKRTLARLAVQSGAFEYVNLPEPENIPVAATLPDTFPHSKLLIKKGFDTLLKVQAASDDELLAINGIAEKSLAEIREAQNANKGE